MWTIAVVLTVNYFDQCYIDYYYHFIDELSLKEDHKQKYPVMYQHITVLPIT